MAFYKEATKQYSNLASSEEAKGYFGILASLLLLILLLVLIYPAVKHITALNKEITDARKVKISLEEKLDALGQARINLEEVKDELPLLDLALPKGPKLPEYLKDVENLLSRRGTGISTIQFQDVALSVPTKTASLKTKKMPYSLGIETGFSEFKDFLADLESNVRISSVNSFVVSREGNGLKEVLNITGYFLGEETGPELKTTGKNTSETP